MMPQGTIPRGPAFFDPVLKGRWGAARLAAMTGAPVIPVGPVGHREGVAAQRAPAEPAGARAPADRHDPGRAGRWRASRATSPDADTKRIMTAITKLLPPEARKKRTPTAEELARTYPGGKIKDTDETTDAPAPTDSPVCVLDR